MKTNSLLLVLCLFSTSLCRAQVGVGTTTPKAFFHVTQGQTVLFGQDTNQVGSTNKLIWYASQGAFRVGGVEDDSWSRSSPTDNTNVGQYSFASGLSTIASGYISTAIGRSATASGGYSTAIGTTNTASGVGAMAMGNSVIASGQYSTAMGNYANTNQKQGSFIIGDVSFNSLFGNDAPNQMMMRFSGGYKLFTNANASIGVSLSSGGNAWQTISDSTRKENFRPVDGVVFLQKIAKLKLGSWNYKGQDATTFRHYGPMAQDFFAAFGRDELGIIGEDKAINQADFDGVNLIAIQALIKQVDKLEMENKSLRYENATLKAETQTRLDKLEAALQRQPASQTVTFKP